MALEYEIESNPVLDENELIRMELGWPEVAGGLLRVVLGYGIFVAGMTVGVGFILLSVFGQGEGVRRGAQPGLGQLWLFYLGLAVTAITGMFSYGMILAGKFACMLNAPERNGARWFMFLCITCLFVGPLLNVASGIMFSQKPPELKKGAKSFEEFQLSETGRTMQMVGFAASLLYPLFFLLFLRSVAVCMRTTWCVWLFNFFLAVCLLLAGVTAYELFYPHRAPIPPFLAMAVQAGWGAVTLLYVVVILLARNCITVTVGHLRNPLEIYQN